MLLKVSADTPIRTTVADADLVPISAFRIEARHILRDIFSMASGFIQISRWLFTQDGVPRLGESVAGRFLKPPLESGRECHRVLVAWCVRLDRSKLESSLVAVPLLAPGGANNARQMSLTLRASRKSRAKFIHSWKAMRNGL